MNQPKKFNHSKKAENFDYFYEDVDIRPSNNKSELPDNTNSGGLSQENVHKLTDDLFNPLPYDSES